MAKYVGENSLSELVTKTKQLVATKQNTLPTTTTAGKVLKSTSTAGTVEWGDVSGSSTDVKINGTSITSNNVADIKTNSAYNASTNKIATMSDLPDISGKQNTITGAATTITNSNLTPNYALVSDASGKVSVSHATATELDYLQGVTNNIPFLLNQKANAFIVGTGIEKDTYLGSERLKLNGVIPYTTTAPTSANSSGLKIAILSSEPATKYSGWLYLIKES